MEIKKGSLPFEALEPFKEALKETGLKSFPLFKDSQFLNLYDNHDLCAFLIYREIDEATIELDFIATSYANRNRGLAQKLIDSLKKFQKKIWIEVHENNQAALGFYKKQGFKLEGRRRGYYSGKDALLMTLIV